MTTVQTRSSTNHCSRTLKGWIAQLAQGALFLAALSACQRSLQFHREEGTPLYPNDTTGQPKKKVFVLPFWNDTPLLEDSLESFAASELLRGLALTRRVILPSAGQSELTTSDLVDAGEVRVAQVVREGRRLGVAALVIGRISAITYRQKDDDVGLLREKQSLARTQLEVKLFDVQTGREIWSGTHDGQSNASALAEIDNRRSEADTYKRELIRAATQQAVALFIPELVQAISKLSWQGKIVKLAGNRAYVDAGQSSGLVIGDILKVLGPGDDIYDPTSGSFLGRSPGRPKGTLEVVDYLGPDGAIARMHTGGNFAQGDWVHLY